MFDGIYQWSHLWACTSLCSKVFTTNIVPLIGVDCPVNCRFQGVLPPFPPPSLYHFTFSSSTQGLQFLASSLFFFVVVLIIDISMDVRLFPTVVLVSVSLTIVSVEHLFMGFLAVCLSVFGEMSIHILTYFFNHAVFLMLLCEDS